MKSLIIPDAITLNLYFLAKHQQYLIQLKHKNTSLWILSDNSIQIIGRNINANSYTITTIKKNIHNLIVGNSRLFHFKAVGFKASINKNRILTINKLDIKIPDDIFFKLNKLSFYAWSYQATNIDHFFHKITQKWK